MLKQVCEWNFASETVSFSAKIQHFEPNSDLD